MTLKAIYMWFHVSWGPTDPLVNRRCANQRMGGFYQEGFADQEKEVYPEDDKLINNVLSNVLSARQHRIQKSISDQQRRVIR